MKADILARVLTEIMTDTPVIIIIKKNIDGEDGTATAGMELLEGTDTTVCRALTRRKMPILRQVFARAQTTEFIVELVCSFGFSLSGKSACS